jgi:hypothetical protein
MTHLLKIWPQYYCRLVDGTKTFEVRKNDRGFQPGDYVCLQEWDPTPVEKDGPSSELMVLISLSPRKHLEPKGFTKNKPLSFKIGYMMPMEKDMVVFSLLPVD